MSGYRSLKRVLGESNLERKCRWLFGICVGGLIILAFFSVGRIAENLIDDTAQYKGRGVARVELFLMHWQRLTNKEEDKDRYEDLVKMQKRLVDELDRAEIDRRMLAIRGSVMFVSRLSVLLLRPGATTVPTIFIRLPRGGMSWRSPRHSSNTWPIGRLEEPLSVLR